MKRDWDPVKLRVSFGDVPEPGCVLALRTGRRYQVLRVAGRTLHCIVVPANADVEGPVWSWQWTPRKRKVAR